jgi:hypothetical protein
MGKITIDNLEHHLTDPQREVYIRTLTAMRVALQLKEANGGSKGDEQQTADPVLHLQTHALRWYRICRILSRKNEKNFTEQDADTVFAVMVQHAAWAGFGGRCDENGEIIEASVGKRIDIRDEEVRRVIQGLSYNLAGADLRYAQLEYVEWSGANLYNTNLEGAYLVGADMRGAELLYARLDKANIVYANFSPGFDRFFFGRPSIWNMLSYVTTKETSFWRVCVW